MSTTVLNRDNELTGATRKWKVAVVFSGCGVYDGTEVHEASAILTHLTRFGITPVVYAPDQDQLEVIDHGKGEPIKGVTRNVLVESARIARGKVEPLVNLKPAMADGVIFPGGFGAAKNLCDFAVKGKDMTVNPKVETVVKAFHKARKPLGFCCIAPMIAAKLFPQVSITLGRKDTGTGEWPYSGAITVAEELGAQHREEDVYGVCIDEKNKIITSPAFMFGTNEFYHIYDGIGNFIQAYVRFLDNWNDGDSEMD